MRDRRLPKSMCDHKIAYVAHCRIEHTLEVGEKNCSHIRSCLFVGGEGIGKQYIPGRITSTFVGAVIHKNSVLNSGSNTSGIKRYRRPPKCFV